MSSRDRLSIAMVSHYFETHRGGVEIVAGRLAREIKTFDIEVTWLATGPMDGVADIQCVRLPALNFLEKHLGLPYPLLYPQAFWRMFHAVGAADAVLVHDGIYLTSLAAFVAAKYHRKPLVIIQHIGEVPYRSPVLRGLMRLANAIITKPLLARAERVAFISRITQHFFADVAFREAPEFIVNGVDTDMFAPTDDARALRMRLTLPQEGPIALFVGRFVEKKGLPLLQKLARLRPDVTFALAGWGSLDPAAWALPNVRTFTGLSGQALADLYRACDVFILPSVGEGFPLVLQEALASGLPCICGEDTAAADPQVATCLTPVRIDPARPDETVAALDTSLQKLLEAPRDSAGLHNMARARYSWARAAQRYVMILRDLTGRS